MINSRKPGKFLDKSLTNNSALLMSDFYTLYGNVYCLLDIYVYICTQCKPNYFILLFTMKSVPDLM